MKNSDYARPATTRQLFAAIKASDEDFEFYPTTDAMIAALKHDIEHETVMAPGHDS